MNTEFELEQTQGVLQSDEKFVLLNEKLFSDSRHSSAKNVLDSFSAPPFKPTSADIDEIMKVENTDGLTRSALREIAEEPGAGNHERRVETAKFLDAHFEDVGKLSASGVDEITRSDLELYSELLSLSEPEGREPTQLVEAWKSVHLEHELKASVLPMLPEVGVPLGSMIATREVASTPFVGEKLAKFSLANPRAFVVSFLAYGTAMGAATWFGGEALGRKTNEYWNRDKINKHFDDEAAPAMKRLMQE